MNDREQQLKTRLLESILEYIEGKRTFSSVTMIGITEQSKNKIIKDKHLAEVIEELNSMANDSINGKNFSREEANQIFTTMLEKLLKG